MTHSDLEPVVVGVDGSDQSMRALGWAAEEAALCHRRLRVVHAFVWPLYPVDLDPPAGGFPDGGLRRAADRIVTEALEHAAAVAPAVEIDGAVVAGTAAPTLLRESERAELLVVGNRGLGGFTGMLVGSVGAAVAAHAACPVVVVRRRQDDGPSAGRVVVGVDGSAASELALGFAFREATRRRTGLTVVHTWMGPVSEGPGDMLPLVHDPAIVGRDEDRLVAETLAGWQEKFPDVEVRRDVVHGHAAKVLVAESRGAMLTVVGSRGRGGFPGLRLGSVSRALLHHADGPLAVVRGHDSRQP